MSKRVAEKVKRRPRRYAESINEQLDYDTNGAEVYYQMPQSSVEGVPSVNEIIDGIVETCRMILRESPVVLGKINKNNVWTLKWLIDTIFPRMYSAKPYDKAHLLGDYGRIAYCTGVPVGAVICKIDEKDNLYIFVIGTLPQFRRCGIGSVLLNYVIKLGEIIKKNITLHVRVDNRSAKRFYQRNGFIETEFVNEFYFREPRGAHHLVKYISTSGGMMVVDGDGEQPGTSAQSNPITLCEVTKENVQKLKMLMQTLFPGMFTTANFEDAHTMGNFGRIACKNDKPVGFIVCRFMNGMLYISLIGILPEYRRHGVGSALLQHAVNYATTVKKDIQLHVQVGNTIAQEFYQKHGFIETERIETYYNNPPRAAFLYTKKICM
ncbi:hypothetical protein GCK72_022944 [Caenorhabditis remanei]|nr:hypothetical protein GCK72_022944 [Caenorhabditis remanei]KAF1746488.1 hypothetical protein GCK72_022944 [Caenorhabditis remanei]